MPNTIQRYILGDVIKTFLICISVFIMLIFMVKIYELSREGLNLELILNYMPYLLPYLLSIAVPISLLAATIMSFSKFSATNEITTIYASGLSLWRPFYVPMLLVALFISISCFFLNERIIPFAADRMAKATPLLSLKQIDWKINKTDSGDIVELEEGRNKIKLYPRENNNRKINIVSYGRDNSIIREINGQNGIIKIDFENMKIDITIENGDSDEHLPDGTTQRITFTSAPITIPAPSSKGKVINEIHTMSLSQLNKLRHQKRETAREIDRLISHIDTTIKENQSLAKAFGFPVAIGATESISGLQIYTKNLKKLAEENRKEDTEKGIELHLKIAQCLIVFGFVFIGIPIGVFIPSSHKLVGLGLAAAVVIIVYYPLILLGKHLATEKMLKPELAMYLPVVIILLIAGGITLKGKK